MSDTESIAYKLSWEMLAMNDVGEGDTPKRLALEIACGIANVSNELALFASVMTNVMVQVSDKEVKRYLQFYLNRGLQS